MRVALVHLRHAETGGTERFLNQLAAFLVAAGHEVTVVCRSHAPGTVPGIRFVVLRSPVPGKTLRVIAFARDVERHVRSGGYDVVLGLGWGWAQDVIRLGGGCLATHRELALAAARSPWQRLLPAVPLKYRVAEALENRALAPGRYRHVIVNSEMVRRDATQRHAIPADRISVVYNGVDTNRFDPAALAPAAQALRQRLGLDAGHRVLLFVGSSFGRKGLDCVLDALPAIAAARPDVRLLVGGGDSRRGEYERRARRLGVAALCRFLGPLADAEVAHGAADVFVLPTLYDPFANVTLEALACGAPVITTRHNGASEILTPGRDGAVLDAPTPALLAPAVIDWLDRARDAAVRGACREVAQYFSATRTASESTRILEAAAAERSAERQGRNADRVRQEEKP
jgi:UDP-glucose:(heptosyl)LPS alpha-1,3-glucosyltransferase